MDVLLTARSDADNLNGHSKLRLVHFSNLNLSVHGGFGKCTRTATCTMEQKCLAPGSAETWKPSMHSLLHSLQKPTFSQSSNQIVQSEAGASRSPHISGLLSHFVFVWTLQVTVLTFLVDEVSILSLLPAFGRPSCRWVLELSLPVQWWFWGWDKPLRARCILGDHQNTAGVKKDIHVSSVVRSGAFFCSATIDNLNNSTANARPPGQRPSPATPSPPRATHLPPKP